MDDYIKLHVLFANCTDRNIRRFMDLENGSHIKEKIKVLELLADGKKPEDIKNYEMVLDNYPDDDTLWY